MRGAARHKQQGGGRGPDRQPLPAWMLIAHPTPTSSIGHNEVIGVCRVGPDAADPHGREHWAEMLANPRKPVEHWHQLVEVSGQPANATPHGAHLLASAPLIHPTHRIFRGCGIRPIPLCSQPSGDAPAPPGQSLSPPEALHRLPHSPLRPHHSSRFDGLLCASVSPFVE